MNLRASAAWPILIVSVLLQFTGCATAVPPDSHAGRFFRVLDQYEGTHEPLRLINVNAETIEAMQKAEERRDVVIMVHPAYSLFFREEKRSRYSDIKYELLARQFDDEARFINQAAGSGHVVLLIVPGHYEENSPAPDAYTVYLNRTAGLGSRVYYLFSETTSSGTISMNEMIDLYRFLTTTKAERVLIGGGYIGRCQREFYTELTNYYTAAPSYIVPEISTISPEDISDIEASAILDGIRRDDYGPVRKFIDRKLDTAVNTVNILPLPALWKRTPDGIVSRPSGSVTM